MIFTKKEDPLWNTLSEPLNDTLVITYLLTRGLESVNTEVSFICLAYNLKRFINIIGVKELIRRFRGGSDIQISKIPYFYIKPPIISNVYCF
jgi:hypothetical protein